MRVDANFDGGNIKVIDSSDPSDIQLHIRKDTKADYSQWFYFRATGIKNIACKFSITNASTVSYPEAWETCTIVVSYDRKKWFRLPTEYDEKNLTFSLTPERSIVYLALFSPYSYEQHQDLIAWSLSQSDCELLACCQTINNNQVELLQIGPPSADKKNIWLIARQHPAETMAEWFAEGFLKELLDKNNPTSVKLLDLATFYVVPNMNPDGGISGNLRTNAAGVDLNRSWLSPQQSSAPESFFVFEKMKAIGVDLFLDIHGDEDIPYAFIAGSEGNPGYTPKLALLDKAFRHEFHAVNPDFCIENGYDADLPKGGDLGIACNQIGEYFDCLSLTIEMPFTDNKYRPDIVHGWSSERSMKLGASVLKPINKLIPSLR